MPPVGEWLLQGYLPLWQAQTKRSWQSLPTSLEQIHNTSQRWLSCIPIKPTVHTPLELFTLRHLQHLIYICLETKTHVYYCYWLKSASQELASKVWHLTAASNAAELSAWKTCRKKVHSWKNTKTVPNQVGVCFISYLAYLAMICYVEVFHQRRFLRPFPVSEVVIVCPLWHYHAPIYLTCVCVCVSVFLHFLISLYSHIWLWHMIMRISNIYIYNFI